MKQEGIVSGERLISLDDYLAKVGEEITIRTLCFLFRDGEILLGRRNRGMGMGKFVGVGGRVESGETIQEATVRETVEEVGCKPSELVNVATVTFLFPYEEYPERWNQEVHVFTSRTWTGDVTESEELAPQWFSEDKVPYDSMWPDAPHWLPRVLSGERVLGYFIYNSNHRIYEKKIDPVVQATLRNPESGACEGGSY